MSLLEKKQLVNRNARGGRKHTFSLTPTGRELAGRVVEVLSAGPNLFVPPLLFLVRGSFSSVFFFFSGVRLVLYLPGIL